jgi:hypothetical protein
MARVQRASGAQRKVLAFAYEVWGRQDLGPNTYGRFSAGESSEAAMSLPKGGTIRVNESLCLANGINPASTMAHEFSHAALFDTVTDPHSRDPGSGALPPIVDELLSEAEPDGGLKLYIGSPYTPHGRLNFYWLERIK